MLLEETILDLILLYLTSGLLFGVAFVAVGVSRLDAAARGTSIMFRVLILPGTMALWPLLAGQWLKTSRQGRNP
jgi:hypothetical protein